MCSCEADLHRVLWLLGAPCFPVFLAAVELSVRKTYHRIFCYHTFSNQDGGLSARNYRKEAQCVNAFIDMASPNRHGFTFLQKKNLASVVETSRC